MTQYRYLHQCATSLSHIPGHTVLLSAHLSATTNTLAFRNHWMKVQAAPQTLGGKK